MEEIARELAKILAPIPAQQPGEPDPDYTKRYKTATDQHRALASELILSARAADLDDPVLARLNELSTQRQEIQQQIRLIIAYGREFVRPEPYKLKSLADAARLSISGVRGIYSLTDTATIATRIGRKNNKGTVFPASPTPAPPDPEGPHWWTVPSLPPDAG
ncbi:MAG TPA: hypothetical protein VKZ82_15555 [Nonomuraea sp.]|uniref:hypothetical protein n=1 Tax=Nonomuraea sp. NPDC049649 TaxID=3155776 RepID=UPI002CF196AA|nr:hypothetical protein [Nonomuraea sp.]